MPVWVEPELATLPRERFSDPAWIFERKLDGERCLTFADSTGVRLKSRNQKAITPSFPEVAAAVAAQRSGDLVVDGEIVAFDGAQTRVERLQHRLGVIHPSEALLCEVPVYYYVFDVLYADGRDVRAGHDVLTEADFDTARDRLLLGHRESSGALLPAEKDAVAIHEAGHALVAMLSEHADPVAKVTILPRGAALGITEQLPEFERHLYPRSYLTDSLTVHLGGRAAEIVVLGEPSTGAADDLASATDLATRMVTEWGLSADVGPVGYRPADLAGEHPLAGRRYAEQTQRAIDTEVAGLLCRAETTAMGLLREHRDALDRVIGLLLERETVDGTDLADVAGLSRRHPGNGRLWPRPASSGSSRP
jgi:Peptidase family M41/ATP dependent DNA ligase domain